MPIQTVQIYQTKPRYSAIAEEIARQIKGGELLPGAQLIGERELCKRFGASRVTVRRALGHLRERGLIEADSSRGWFVSSPTVGEANALISFSEMARRRGLRPTAIVVHDLVRPADLDEADALQIAPGSEIFDLRRVRKLDDVPVGIEQSRIPLKLAAGVLHANYRIASLYGELEKAGVRPAYAEYSIRAVAASNDEAELLQVSAGTALLLVSATTWLGEGLPIELSQSLFLGDRYRFQTTLFRSRRQDPS